MKEQEIRDASKPALFARLRELQKEFDAGEWTDPLPILREHIAVMKELKGRGLSEIQIETGIRIEPVP